MKLVLLSAICLCLAGCVGAEKVASGIKSLFVSPNGDPPIKAAFDIANYFFPGATAIGGMITVIGGLFIKKKVQARGERKLAEAVSKIVGAPPSTTTTQP